MSAEDTSTAEDRAGRYQDFGRTSEQRSAFDRYGSRIQTAFTSDRLRDHILGPFREALSPQGETTADQVRAVITQVAVVNAVLAGLPGKMGVGVAVSMALEGWMAFRIARHVGHRIDSFGDVLKYFGLVAGAIVTILVLFRHLLGFAFALFAGLPFLNPMIPAELLVTNFVGVLFWTGFREAKRTGSFSVPKRTFVTIVSETKGLLSYQWSALKAILTLENIQTVGGRFRAWVTGESVPLAASTEGRGGVRDDVFIAVASAALLSGQHHRLDGPLGQEFLQAIRDSTPSLADASTADIAKHMAQYDSEQLTGVLANIKGRLFERLVERTENLDGDEWVARLHEDRTYPGTDMVLENTETGESFAVSLKATDSAQYVESALSRYPDDPIFVTDEVAEQFPDDARVVGTGFPNEELDHLTEKTFDELLEDAAPSGADAVGAVGLGTGIGAAVSLWPFVAAYHRGRITSDQLEEACERFVGESGVRLAVNLVAIAAFGPVWLWFVMAKAVTGVAQAGGVDAALRPARPQQQRPRPQTRPPRDLPPTTTREAPPVEPLRPRSNWRTRIDRDTPEPPP